MSDTPISFTGSWVDLTGELSSGTVSPIMPGGDSQFIRMLKEAQVHGDISISYPNSSRTSRKVSPFMSHNSPRSPPNSPNNGKSETNDMTDLSDVYINTLVDRDVPISDFIWDWSSRPNIIPPKQWKLTSSKTSQKSFKVFSSAKSDNKFMFTVVITNIISLIIGAGVGVWIFRSKSSNMSV